MSASPIRSSRPSPGAQQPQQQFLNLSGTAVTPCVKPYSPRGLSSSLKATPPSVNLVTLRASHKQKTIVKARNALSSSVANSITNASATMARSGSSRSDRLRANLDGASGTEGAAERGERGREGIRSASSGVRAKGGKGLVDKMKREVATVAMQELNNKIGISGVMVVKKTIPATTPVSATPASGNGGGGGKGATVDLEKMRVLTLQRIANTKKEAERKIALENCRTTSSQMRRMATAAKRKTQGAVKAKRRTEIYAVNEVMRLAFEEKYNNFCATMMCKDGTHGVADEEMMERVRKGQASGGGNFGGVGAV